MPEPQESSAFSAASWAPCMTRRLDDDVFDYIRDRGVSAGKTLGKLLHPGIQPDAFVVETHVSSLVPAERLHSYTGAIHWPGEPRCLGLSGREWLIARLHAILTANQDGALMVSDPMSSEPREQTGREFHREAGIEAITHDDGDYYILRPGDKAPERIFYAIQSATNAWMEFGAVTSAPLPAGTISTDEFEAVARSVTHLFQTVYDGDSWLLATRA